MMGLPGAGGSPWLFVLNVLPSLLAGLRFTTIISIASFLCALPVGLGICMMRMSRIRIFQSFSFVYTQIFRSLSTYVYILFIYFGLPALLGINLDPVVASIISLTLLNSAYISEIFRGSISAVDHGQWEASLGLGMTSTEAFTSTILPQAVRISLPALVAQYIVIVKDSAIVGIVGVSDIMFVAENRANVTYLHFQLFTAVALIYIVVVFSLSQFGALLERRLKVMN